MVSVPVMLLIISGSVLMVLTTIFGFRAIDRLSRVAAPLLALMLLSAVLQVFQDMRCHDAGPTG